jgi:hypothetical protein
MLWEAEANVKTARGEAKDSGSGTQFSCAITLTTFGRGNDVAAKIYE